MSINSACSICPLIIEPYKISLYIKAKDLALHHHNNKKPKAKRQNNKIQKRPIEWSLRITLAILTPPVMV